MNKKIKVLLLMGGKSSEHDVSIASGTEIVKNLDPKKYHVLPVVISRDGSKWKLTDKSSLLKLKDIISNKVKSSEITLQSAKPIGGINSFSKSPVDVVFIAIHGPYGEDGTVQGMLELAGIKYTGSGVLASAIGMDKIIFRKLMAQEKIPVPKYVVVKRGENFKHIHKVLKRASYFVKPHDQGSSVGASIVRKQKDLGNALKLAHRFSKLALVDEYIKGIEVTCGVLGNDKPFALPLVEIVPKNDFFDYESKYAQSGTDEIVPARINKKLTVKIQNLAIQVYKAIGARGFGRVDFILNKGKDPYVLEINTIPGLTSASLLPKGAKEQGITYPELLDRVIKYALEK
ncbi:MAG TPA: D-alanine--D-alanine ligase family protein [Patescibacteria group bacterium]|nr:D-alanine--D-alanine ligase family protein [Patescibacteria group bacterium]